MVLLSIIESLKSIDNSVLLWINSRHSDTLDTVMWNASSKTLWIPLYAIFAWLIIEKFGKASWLPILLVVLTIIITDQGSDHFIKNMVMRYRPSHNLALQSQLHFVNGYTGGQYGFVSSHAANTTAFALFMILLFRKKIVTVSLICWVALVCYSRMYLGVHYPSDILGGMILGLVTVLLTFALYNRIENKLPRKRTE
ncbi:MAG TPA: phosphatase PAP2 family protein [Bacteroidia bacterium]|jgi:undecaprenyl-diphosphatase|nr:phosphatase PAP2 family protein [Bacteroidia bacterium]